MYAILTIISRFVLLTNEVIILYTMIAIIIVYAVLLISGYEADVIYPLNLLIITNPRRRSRCKNCII